MEAVRCEQCGGAVAAAPGKPEPACLFCGGTVFTPVDPRLVPAAPQRVFPFRIDKAEADAAFRAFARSSFWYPRSLRDADLQLRQLLVPAWWWHLSLTLHWTGLVSAATRSGKRPVSGTARAPHAGLADLLVPASAALTQAELTALGAFDDTSGEPWDPDTTDLPHELGEVSERASRKAAFRELERRAGEQVASERGLIHGSIKTRHLPGDEAHGEPVLIPIWIGVYTYEDVPRHVVINGHTGVTAGDAPLDWPKIFAVGAGAVLLVGLLLGVLASL